MDDQRAREETIEAYQTYGAAVLAYARRLTRDDALAQDAVQETFLRFFLARMQQDPIQSPRAWLHRVAHNYICEIFRSSAIRTAVSLDEAGEDRLQDLRAFPDTENWATSLEGLRSALAPREWQCLQLRAEGFGYTEIAAEMAIRPGTVGALLHRATDKLRRRMQKKGSPA